MSHHLLLIIHLISAAVWVGGHLYLCISILPGTLMKKDAGRLLEFEKSYEPLGMAALAALVVTGIWMVLQLGIPIRYWFSFSAPLERAISAKLLLLAATVVTAVSAQTRVIPKLKTGPQKLPEMAVHIVCVTFLGLAMLILGSFVRYGGI